MQTQRSKPIFLNQRGFEIHQKEIREEIYKNIRRLGNFAVSSKYYTFLNKKNLYEIKDGDFRVSLSSYGKKFVLFLISIQDRKYSILMNKKNEVMIHSSYKFHQSLYEGTLLDGELVKNEDNKWIFIVNDVPYYKGENMITKNFDTRMEVLDTILEREYLESEDQMTYVVKKIYFPIENMEDMSRRFRESLNYKTSGIYFKNVYNYSDNYLYVFPECRTDHQILNPVEVKEKEKEEEVEEKKEEVEDEKRYERVEEEDDIFGDVEVVQEERKREPEKDTKLERKYCKFLIRPTVKPDVYELYCRSVDRHIEKYSYAGIPNMSVSQFVRGLFVSMEMTEDITTLIKERKAIYVECKYHKIFKKWIPYKRCEDMDHHTFINKVQILLDNRDDDSESDSDEEE